MTLKKTAFLDTNTIDKIQSKGLTAEAFGNLLTNHGFIPVIGAPVIYEHAKCYEKKPDVMKTNFNCIKTLSPIVSCSRDLLWKMEYLHLTRKPSINYIELLNQSQRLIRCIDDLSKGIVTDETKEVIYQRKKYLPQMRDNWIPRGLQEQYKKEFSSFEDRRQKVLQMLSINQESQDMLKLFFTQCLGFSISNADMFNFIENLDFYPAIRTMLYQHIYLDFSAETENKRPAIGKLHDGIQMVEAAYCSAIISSDESLIKTHGKCLNQQIELIYLDDLC